MRVISGKARGCKLISLDGLNTRPTTDRIKETLFNIINMDVIDSNFLDVFGGSGGIAIEALSRGAKSAVIIEKNEKAVEVINKNLLHTNVESLCKVFNKDSIPFLKDLNSTEKFDIIFIDPPYELKLYIEVITIILEKKLLNNDGIIIVERSTFDDEYNFEELEVYKNKKFKTTTLDFLRYR